MRLGIIARSDNTGLGNQTRELVKMLNPDKILLINSSHFNQNKQHPEWYKGYNVTFSAQGFLRKEEVRNFIEELDVVITCETFYNNEFILYAKRHRVKVIMQYNYEFLEHMRTPDIEVPDVFLAPSHWHTEKVYELFKDRAKVIYLPPPTDPELFKNAREINTSKKHNRILHVAGKAATKDRNGTEIVPGMLAHSKEDYLVVIKTQSQLDLGRVDPRIIIDSSSPENHADLYSGFDAVVLPRRYGGLCLPMNEALMSGLPVFMSDISPNNKILPQKWLTESGKMDTFRARVVVDVYETNQRLLARQIDAYMRGDIAVQKQEAFDLGMKNYSPASLKEEYLKLMNS